MHNRVKVPPTIFRLKHGTLIERLPDCTLLFSEQDQQIHEVNQTSAVLADRLVAGATEGELVGELLSHGAEPAAEWVRTFLEESARSGLLEADRVEVPASAATQRVKVHGQPLSLRYGSPDLERLLAPAFVHLEEIESGPAYELELSGDKDLVFIGSGEGSASVVPRPLAAVRLKGLILERALGAAGHLAALHAACLERNGKALLLLGSPGAGKTTLSLALMKHGFRYGSDDVTLVKATGEVEGVPLAPAVKEAAWAIAEDHGASLEELPIHLRPDGLHVRFVTLKKELLAGSCRVGAILCLRRGTDQPTALEPISPQKALAELFRESRSANGRCSGEIMQALTELVRRADCFDLRYSDAGAAALVLAERMTR